MAERSDHRDVAEAGLATARAALARRIAGLGLGDPRIPAAFERIPRHLFVPEIERALAYEDRALPLVDEQTISQPSMIALMLGALRCGIEDRVLEIGAGSGYAAALLSTLAAEVDAVELRPRLAEGARRALNEARARNVTVTVGDGTRGLPEKAPFDRILVSAAARTVPSSLLDQLAPRGRIVVPVGHGFSQTLRVGQRRDDGIVWRDDVPCLFVPLVGS